MPVDVTRKEKEAMVKKVMKQPGAILSEVEFDEDAVLSSYDEAFVPRCSTDLPDPSVAVEAHSDEAIVRALAIIRR